MSLDPGARDVLVLVALGLGLLALVLAVVLLVRTRRMRRDYSLLQGEDGAESFVTAVARKVQEVEDLRAQVEGLTALLERTRVELADAIRHVSVVRYDAFQDMGGRMSFSAALLDDGGDGLVLTSIHARTESRSYIKGVRAGTADVGLSPEEQQAITYALRGQT